jgi:Methylamine utilisation protein MauE
VISALGFAAAIGLGGLFLWSGIAKLYRGNVVGAIEDYRLLPDFAVRPFASLLPWLELGIGIALLTGFIPALALWLATVLLGLFAIAMAINLLRGRRTACGCQGRADEMVAWPLVARNAFLATLAASTAVGIPTGGLQVLLFGGNGLTPTSALVALLTLITILVFTRLTLVSYRSILQLQRLPAQRSQGLRDGDNEAIRRLA